MSQCPVHPQDTCLFSCLPGVPVPPSRSPASHSLTRFAACACDSPKLYRKISLGVPDFCHGHFSVIQSRPFLEQVLEARALLADTYWLCAIRSCRCCSCCTTGRLGWLW